MDINKLFEDLSNKQIAKVIADLRANKTLGPKIKDFEMLSDGYSILKNPKTRAQNIKTLRNYNKKIKSFINYFDNSLENPSEIIARKKAGIKSIPKEIDTLKRIEGNEKITALRGYIAKLNTLNTMLEKIYNNDDENITKTISNTYDGNVVFKKEDGKSDKIISIVDYIAKTLEEIMFENTFSSINEKNDVNNYFKRIKENLSEAYLSIDEIRKKAKELSGELNLSKVNRSKREKELEDAIKNLEQQKKNINDWINNPNLINQKIDLRKRKIEELRKKDRENNRAEENPEIRRLNNEVENLESAKRDGGKRYWKEITEKIERYHNALSRLGSRKSEWSAHNDFEKSISKYINGYFYNINNFKKIISKNDGEIVGEIKKKEELVDQLTREVAELEKYPRLSNISFEDKEAFEELINLKKKLIDKIGESKKLIGSPKLKEFEDENKRIQDEIRSYISTKDKLISDKAKEKGVKIEDLSDKEVNEIIKQVREEKFPKEFNVKNFDERFFEKYYWKIKYTDKNVFNYLRNIFSNEEIEKRNQKIKNEIIKGDKYKEIKKYLGDGDASNYLRTMLTLDAYYKDNRRYSVHSAEALYRASQEAKDFELARQAKEAMDLERSAEEEKEDAVSDETLLNKEYTKRAKEAYKETPKDDDIELSVKDKKGKKEFSNEFGREKYTNKSDDVWTEKDEIRYQKMLKAPIRKPESEEKILLKNIEKYKEKLPSLYNMAKLLINPSKEDIKKDFTSEIKDFNNEAEKLEKIKNNFYKEIEDFDEKWDVVLKDKEKLPDLKDVKDVSDQELNKIKSDFDKLFKFSKKYISHIAKIGAPLSFKPGIKITEKPEKRNEKTEFKIKRGLINIIKRLYKENEETYKKLIRETQKKVEPYQPKTIGINKVGKIKERQDFKFSDVMDIFNFIKNTISEKKDYPEKIKRNIDVIKNNQKYNELEDQRKKISDKIDAVEKRLGYYEKVRQLIKDKEKEVEKKTPIITKEKKEEKDSDEIRLNRALKKLDGLSFEQREKAIFGDDKVDLERNMYDIPISKLEQNVDKFLKDLKG